MTATWTRIVFGVKPVRPIVNLPPEAIKVRIRLRSGKRGTAFVRYPDRIEKWTLGFCNNNPQDDWRLAFLEGVNQ
jgi:hypothetical protein